jgi:hypothetical protein
MENVRYRIMSDFAVSRDIILKQGQEIGILNNVVYVDGNLVPLLMQDIFFRFVKENQNILRDISNL